MLSHDLLQKQEIFCNMVTELQANLFSTRKLAGSKEKKNYMKFEVQLFCKMKAFILADLK